MIKDNVQIKKELSIVDKIKMTKDLVAGYFIDNEYTPYYSEINHLVAFFTYCVSGITFEKAKDDEGNEHDESVYNAVVNDKELMEIWNKSMKSVLPSRLKGQLDEIMEDVADIVEFEKQRLIHSSAPVNKKILEILDKESRNKDAELKLMEEAEKLEKEYQKQLKYINSVSELMTPDEISELNKLVLKNGEYDPNALAQMIAEKYFASDKHAENVQSVLEEKNKRIRELDKHKKMHDARNVLSDKVDK